MNVIKKNFLLKYLLVLLLIVISTNPQTLRAQGPSSQLPSTDGLIHSNLPDASSTFNGSVSTKLDYSGWVKCDGVVTPGESGRTTECNFSNLIEMAKLLINWLFGISIPIIIGILAYAGFLHITGKEADIKKSYEMIQRALWGFVIMLMAWFIVTTLLKWVLNSDFTNVAGTLIDTQK